MRGRDLAAMRCRARRQRCRRRRRPASIALSAGDAGACWSSAARALARRWMPPTRETLLRQAADWLTRKPAERAQLRARTAAPGTPAAAERARRRAPFLAWQRLADVERAQLRAAARAPGRPARRRAGGLARAIRRARRRTPSASGGWARRWARQLAPIASLFAFLPEADRPALAGRACAASTPAARADLATLAPRLERSAAPGLAPRIAGRAAGHSAPR